MNTDPDYSQMWPQPAQTGPQRRHVPGCSSKHRYADKRTAHGVINSLLSRRRQRRGRHEGHLRAYACPACGGWHLTSEVQS